MPFLLNYKRADRVPTVLVQEALLLQGFTPGPADGRFGLSTLRAVVAYQRQNKLEETGSVNMTLYEALVSGTKPAVVKPKEKAAAKKPAAKKSAAKSTTAKKPAAKKPATKKAKT